ncbi:4-diphosphocytidyl-2-C-methyl-D-erythritol kinase [Aliidongia dinghuensis]|uniref:4-diphosphocytidyl-2-C-methyl-D-erythritol kinase n=1 Tax=Aliidongia dinghuensis TaxID=1867774 RepID=A0A8J2YTY4_9PROT|nr:4-(cytidine 5'-diphospho)-2-C-methyl-D-erythritol kinase [Aliidongia dinghuensis]GGF18260.1 4-diphosphocytidyl-2-C-methyl-D-erythritol kinase [Aliidongia dinghuensis]
MTEVVRAAPAKLNLTLEVVGRRADGYHLLDSLVAFTEYGDTVKAATAEAGEFGLTLAGDFGPFLIADAFDNLVLKAARLLAEEAGIKPAAQLTLTKRLPVASGIGGGSSDAAATLLALAALWQVSPAPEDLARIALKLGADVPVCLATRTARLEGIGERISPAPAVPPAPIVLVNPGVGLATPKVFQAREGAFSPGAGPAGVLSASPADATALADALRPYGNDLTPPAIGLMPVIGQVLERLEATEDCLLARMSGSGATCFALFPTDAAAEAAASAIRAAEPRWWAVATRLKAA